MRGALLAGICGFEAALTCLLLAVAPVLASQPKPASVSPVHEPWNVRFEGKKYDLRRESGLRDLDGALNETLARHERAVMLTTNSLLAPDPAASTHRKLSSDTNAKETRRLQLLQECLRSALGASAAAERELCLQDVVEMTRALENATRSPVPSHVDFVQAPWLLWEYYHDPVGRGVRPAANVTAPASRASDLSKVDPPNSSFWTRPVGVGREDLYAGFDRSALPDLAHEICRYKGPKTGFGTSPGFEVRCGLWKLKVKFAETHSEPFAARIFAALGYNVEPTDFVPRLRLAYDRRIFSQFDMRKAVNVRVTTFLIPSHTIRIQKRYDPFDFIAAVLKDGRRLAGDDLKRLLFTNPSVKHPEDEPSNFNPSGEQQVDYLLTAPANVHFYTPGARSVGPWDFDELGHADLRELRGLALLAAWVGWFDCRFINTRLKVIEANHEPEVRHFLTDLGSCLGKSSGLTSRQCEEVDQFGWSFTRPSEFHGAGRMARSFRIVDFQPLGHPRAFREMTLDDARWMGRWIGQLSEEQIRQALAAAGFGAARVRVYTDKLISRRDQMIRDLGLVDEIGLLRPGKVARR
jgi:hypothetical protein